MHDIPVLLKDNIGTDDRMPTIAGSIGRAGQSAGDDSTVAARLHAGGAASGGSSLAGGWHGVGSWQGVG